ncbi:hypothetical protein ACFWXO_05385 [Kitasatospora sp. NPDC059088]|uniref:hypothetical protein n=1 Tax=Kitasatospora sp. NPDC059088 TaxID=3346722 RepID=UPI0036B5A590
MSTPYLSRGTSPTTWVTEGYPAPLLHVLSKAGGLPHTVPALVRQELEHRRPAELRERIERRWYLRYSNLSRPELEARADEIAVELIQPSDCPDPKCEDGSLLENSSSCPHCRPSRTRFDIHPEHLPDGNARASIETVARVAALIRAQMRQTHGVPRGERSRHTISKDLPEHVPAPYRREAEPPLDDSFRAPAERWRLREPEPNDDNRSRPAAPGE